MTQLYEQVYQPDSNGHVPDGAILMISSGVTSSGVTVDNGGNIFVSSGGAANATIVGTSGGLSLLGGSASGTTVSTTGVLEVTSGGVAENTMVTGGQVVAENDGTLNYTSVYGASVDSNGSSIPSVLVSAGGLAVSGQLYSGATMDVYGSAEDTTVNSASKETVFSGGVASRQTIQSGGSAVVESGGTLIQRGLNGTGNLANIGSIVVSNGGFLSAGVAAAGGVTTVLSGGTAKDVIAANAGSVVFSSGAILQGTTVARSGGTISGGNLTSGASLQVESGGEADNPTATDGTTIVVSNGGLISGGTAVGGVLISGDFKGGGVITILSGGTAKDMVLGSSGSVGKIYFSSGAVVEGTTVLQSGGFLSGANLTSTTSLQVQSGSQAYNVTLGSGATINLADGGSLWNTEIDGGTLNLSGGGNGASDAFVTNGTTFTSNGGTVNLDSGYSENRTWNVPSAVTVNVASGATLSNAVVSSGGDITVANGGVISGTVTLNITGVESKGFTLSDGTDGWLDFEVCFLSGSMIQTPNGEVAVETLRLGDEVTAYVNGMPQPRRVVWAGKSHATARPHLAPADAGYPVRILKDAIADGVPYKDMLITPEHCLFFYGRFVPARMLVNGSSIFYDTSITSYEYFHVETEEHSVLRADGMLTESYLDTGNRRTFRQAGSVVALGAGCRDWATDAAVPLCVERAFVEPLFYTLAARAGAPASAAVTTNPDLHLVTQNGALIRPVSHQGAQYRFMLPPGVSSVRIVSHASRPSDAIGPFVDDRRALGVAIAGIQLITVDQKHSLTAHLQTEQPSGWYGAEAGEAGPVWTNGNALLPLPVLERNAMSMLSLEVLAAGPYLLADQTEMETTAYSA